MDIDIKDNIDRTPQLIDQLFRVWERSVRATHSFLTAQDIKGIASEVPGALGAIDCLAVAYRKGRPVAFSGVRQGKLEVLFCDPEVRGQKVGSALLCFAIERWDIHRLDCNEQNLAARGFYEHKGFVVVGRSKTDGAGRPFPQLHFERSSGVRAQMASGTWFDAATFELAQDRAHAHEIMRTLTGEGELPAKVRREKLASLLGSLGKGSTMMDGMRIDYGYYLFVGEGCFFNFNATFLDGAPITFGDRVWVDPNCTFVTTLHPLVASERLVRTDAADRSHVWERNVPITIGNDVWIASNVVVNPGVNIGAGAVIGSGSVVVGDIPPYTLACGNPCRPVRAITDADRLPENLETIGC